MEATIVTTSSELAQIHALNKSYLREQLSEKEKKEEGFLTWLYTMPVLEQLHTISPAIIVKNGEEVAGYALAATKEAKELHPDLKLMIENIQRIPYKQKPLEHYNWYIMGQICVKQQYRGRNVFTMLYNMHRQVYGARYDMLVTEISVHNARSLKAHTKMGFETIHSYKDALDEWNVVVWNWHVV